MLLGTVLLMLVLAVNAVFGFSAALKPLYLLPIWGATRLDGRRSGLLMVALTTFGMTAIDASVLRAVGSDEVAAEALLRFCTLGGMMLIIAHVEESLLMHRKMAFQDPLTGVLNRRALVEFAQRAFGRAKQVEEPLVAVVIDCDGFKCLNDTYGHHAGDHVLRMLARLLENETRRGDLVARTGGDEFVIILQDTDAEEAKHVMQRIEQQFEQAVGDAGYECSISFGFAPMEEESSTVDSLIATADRAMYRRKERKKSRAFLN